MTELPKNGDDAIGKMFVGDMGIKRILNGDEEIYLRPGGYFYLELNTEEEVNHG